MVTWNMCANRSLGAPDALLNIVTRQEAKMVYAFIIGELKAGRQS